jgi:hypothetical protein
MSQHAKEPVAERAGHQQQGAAARIDPTPMFA